MSVIQYRRLPALVALFAAMLWCALPALAQRAPLQLGSIHKRSVTQLPACPAGFFPGMTCFDGQVESCPNTSTLGFTYGYVNPIGEILGTIVMFEGGGGTIPYENPAFAQKYLESGFQIVYVTWDTDWEFTDNNRGTSIKYAACRPATFLNYIDQNLYSRGGMCAQGFSAGSAQLGYALAWYGSADFLDNVELLSGPVFSDIEQGCVVPHAPTVTVCDAGQFGCNGAEWPDSPAYVGGDETAVGGWSGQPSCNNGRTTTLFANSAWKQMSIVDGTTNPIFSYPQTSLAGWLCSNVNTVQNDTAAEGEFFYQQFTSSRQTAGFSVTRIDHCAGPEGVPEGITPQNELGLVAISNHMISSCVPRH